MIQNSYGFLTLFKRETSRYTKVYVQTLVSPILTNVLFLGIFGGVFASRSVGIEGINYLAFLVPGLCAIGAINAGFMNPSSSLMIQKYSNIEQDLNSYPLTDFEKTLAFTLSGTLRGLIVGLLTFVATIPFAGGKIEHIFLFVFMLSMISFLFSCIGLIIGLAAKTFDSINFAQTIVITPLTYFGGVFFEVGNLPGIFSKIAQLNPFYPMIDGIRFAYIGTSEGSLSLDIGVIMISSLVGFLVAHWCMRRGIGLKT